MERIHIVTSRQYGTIVCANSETALHLMDKLQPCTYDYQITEVASSPQEIDFLLCLQNSQNKEAEPTK